jgi:DNA-binding GntR family transcriptional regulator
MSVNTTPQYRKVYEMLRKHIAEGIYKTGDLLPSENELCITHQTTRPTIRKALDSLVNEGFIKKQQGKGSIVMGLPKGIGILSISGTTSAIGNENLRTEIIAKPTLIKRDEAFGFELSELEKEVGFIYMERLRYMNNKPVFFDISLIPNINLPRFTSRNMENKSLFDVLRKFYRIEVKGGEQKIMAISANKLLQKHFKVEDGHPVLMLNRKIETNRLNFYIYSQVYCNTAEHALYGTF